MKELTESVPLPEPESPAPLTLWHKLAEVAAACSYVQKGGVNLFHKYNYATAADVLEKVSHALFANGLVSWTEPEIHSEREKPTKSGGVDHIVTARVRLHVVDCDTGQEVIAMGFGSGMDSGDKAVMKAQTAALKYAWMMLLNISTGDDPEADDKVDQRVSGQKKEKAEARGPKTGDFTAADKELARQAEADRNFTQKTDNKMRVELAKAGIPTDEACDLCGAAMLPYISKKGVTYYQCTTAHDAWNDALGRGLKGNELKAVTKGHGYRLEKEGAGPVDAESNPPEAPAEAPAPSRASSKEKLEELFQKQTQDLNAPPF